MIDVLVKRILSGEITIEEGQKLHKEMNVSFIVTDGKIKIIKFDRN